MTTAAELVAQLRGAGLTLGTCESLTGGQVAARITSVPGASAVFRGGLVTYASDLKATLVGVDPGRIASDGVINAYTAETMARGALELLRVDLAAACTGVAGPDPQDGAPVGTVWICVAAGNAEDEVIVETRRLALAGDRATIQGATVDELIGFVALVARSCG